MLHLLFVINSLFIEYFNSWMEETKNWDDYTIILYNTLSYTGNRWKVITEIIDEYIIFLFGSILGLVMRKRNYDKWQYQKHHYLSLYSKRRTTWPHIMDYVRNVAWNQQQKMRAFCIVNWDFNVLWSNSTTLIYCY